MPTTNKILIANNIEKKFGELEVLKGISLEVNKGEVIVIIGPSGSGKSTFLRCLIQLEKIDAGEIIIDGMCLAQTKNNILEYAAAENARIIKLKMGMVFQNFPLFPHKTVLENLIEAPIRVLKMPKKLAVSVAENLLKKIGLIAKRDAYPFQLSGGQKQRVAIARALAMQPEIILFDEPTSALDRELVSSILEVIKKLAIEEHKTVIITTHQLGFAEEVADRLIFMDQGCIVEEGNPSQLLNNPQNARLRDFLADDN